MRAALGAEGRDGSGAGARMLAARGAEGKDERATAALRSGKLSGRCCGGRGTGGSVVGGIARCFLPRQLVFTHSLREALLSCREEVVSCCSVVLERVPCVGVVEVTGVITKKPKRRGPGRPPLTNK